MRGWQPPARKPHLFCFQFYSQQLFHAGLVVFWKTDLADSDAAQDVAVGRQLGFQLDFDQLLDFAALGRIDFAHRVTGENLVDHALHVRLDDGAIDILRQGLCIAHHARLIQCIAHREVDAQGQPFNRLERRLVWRGAVDLVQQRHLA